MREIKCFFLGITRHKERLAFNKKAAVFLLLISSCMLGVDSVAAAAAAKVTTSNKAKKKKSYEDFFNMQKVDFVDRGNYKKSDVEGPISDEQMSTAKTLIEAARAKRTSSTKEEALFRDEAVFKKKPKPLTEAEVSPEASQAAAAYAPTSKVKNTYKKAKYKIQDKLGLVSQEKKLKRRLKKQLDREEKLKRDSGLGEEAAKTFLYGEVYKIQRDPDPKQEAVQTELSAVLKSKKTEPDQTFQENLPDSRPLTKKERARIEKLKRGRKKIAGMIQAKSDRTAAPSKEKNALVGGVKLVGIDRIQRNIDEQNVNKRTNLETSQDGSLQIPPGPPLGRIPAPIPAGTPPPPIPQGTPPPPPVPQGTPPPPAPNPGRLTTTGNRQRSPTLKSTGKGNRPAASEGRTALLDQIRGGVTLKTPKVDNVSRKVLSTDEALNKELKETLKSISLGRPLKKATERDLPPKKNTPEGERDIDEALGSAVGEFNKRNPERAEQKYDETLFPERNDDDWK